MPDTSSKREYDMAEWQWVPKEMLKEAFIAGANAVHVEWVASDERGDGPPRGTPDFTEAASDYATAKLAAPSPPRPDALEAMREARSCIEDLGRSHEAKIAAGWAWEEVIQRIDAALKLAGE